MKYLENLYDMLDEHIKPDIIEKWRKKFPEKTLEKMVIYYHSVVLAEAFFIKQMTTSDYAEFVLMKGLKPITIEDVVSYADNVSKSYRELAGEIINFYNAEQR